MMDFSNEQRVALYRKMLLIRRFEERLHEVFAEREVAGTCHLCIGQEAVSVGVAAALRRDDYMNGTHRGHGHFIAKGGDVKRIMAEVFGREAGYARGRGGSQHMADFSIGFLGPNGITGGGIPAATGAALAVKQKGEDRVVAAMLGDGAANQGVFHECVNMAALWRLPVVYVCENNLYAMSTPFAAAFASANVSERVKGFGLPTEVVDGNDVLAVADAVGRAAGRARAGEGPGFIECMTYRLSGHSRSDRMLYRTREEENGWQALCPVLTFGRRLVSEFVLTDADIDRIDAEVRDEVRDAEAFARSAAPADVACLADDVFETGGGG